MKVAWGRPTRESVTWKLESRVKESYLELIPSGNFLGKNFFKCGSVVTP